MKLWPVLTGIALSFTLIACKAPTPPKGVQPITNFDANWICPYISRHLLSLNPSLAHCRRYSRGER